LGSTSGVLKSQLLEEPTRSTRIVKREEGAAALLVDSYSGTQEVFSGPVKDTDLILKAYESVSSQVSIEQRVQPVRDAYRSLLESSNKIEDLIDKMVLKGRPGGRCTLCPDQSLVELGGRSSLGSKPDYFGAPVQPE